MTPARLKASVRSALQAHKAGDITEDQAVSAILADSSEHAAWWIEQTFRGDRWTVAGIPVAEHGGAA